MVPLTGSASPFWCRRSGTPVFVGTRVPLATLLDYLEAGQPLSEFLEDFPTVTRDHAVAALEQAKEALIARARASDN
jgi:uncharacterized protein (DUF433 family)